MVGRLAPALRDRVLLRFDFREDDKPRLVSVADVIAYPSQYESYGIAFLEAWAAGKPVIGCRCGAVAEVVHENADGLLVPYADPRALAAAIAALLDDPARARTPVPPTRTSWWSTTAAPTPRRASSRSAVTSA